MSDLERCYDCGRPIADAHLVRRDVEVGSSYIPGDWQPGHVSRTVSHFARVSLCRGCSDSRDDRQRAKERTHAIGCLIIVGVLVVGVLVFFVSAVITGLTAVKDQPSRRGTEVKGIELHQDAPAGVVIIKAAQDPLPSVVAYIEVDGAKVLDWPNRSREVRVVVSAGTHRIVVRSKYQGHHYQKDYGRVTVAADNVTTLILREVEPDPEADE